MNAVCEDCWWYHDGVQNNCWLGHIPCEQCGDFEPMNGSEDSE